MLLLANFYTPHLKSINFHQNKPKIKLILKKKYKIFDRWELHPQPPETAPPPSADFWLRA